MTRAGEGRYRGQTICIVDNDPSICDALSLAFAVEGISCRTFLNGAAFLSEGAALQPLCLLLDIEMPGMNGLDVLAELKRRHYRVPVIIISGKGDIPLAVEAIRRGAIDFLEKPFGSTSVVRDVLRRVAQIEDAPAADSAIDVGAIPGGIALTPRERDVLRAIASGASNKEAGRMLGISPRTVEVHRAKIMDKLGARNAADLVRIVMSAA